MKTEALIKILQEYPNHDIFPTTTGTGYDDLSNLALCDPDTGVERLVIDLYDDETFVPRKPLREL